MSDGSSNDDDELCQLPVAVRLGGTGGERKRWRMPITDGPFAESKEMFGGPGVDRRVRSEEV